MAVGDKIRTVDYNTIQTKVSNILGTGSGNLGYGQTVQSSSVDTTRTITVNEWGQLRNDIINIYRHQNNSIPDTTILPQTVENASVRFSASDAPVTVWDTLSTTLQNNRVNAVPVGRLGTLVPTPSTASSGTITWSSNAFIDITFSWANAESARFFFNGGGRLRVGCTATTTNPENQSNSWVTFLGTVGVREWGGYFPNTGTTPIDGTNYWRSDGTARRWLNISNTVIRYTSNRYELYASKSGSNVVLRIRLVDAYTDPGGPPPGDAVVGNFTASASCTYPAGALTGLGTATWNEYQPTSITFGTWSYT
jgi:hypothetical protein